MCCLIEKNRWRLLNAVCCRALTLLKKKELNDSLTAAAVQLFLAEVSAGYLYRTESFLEHERYKNPGHESS